MNSTYGNTQVTDEYARRLWVESLIFPGVVSEVSWTADLVDTRIAVVNLVPVTVLSLPYPVNPLVIDGKTRKVRYICNYNKTSVGPSTINFQFVIGGITLTFVAFSPAAGLIANRTFTFEVTVNFRAGNQAHAMIQLFNNTVNGDITEQTQRTLVLGTWDKTIANTIDFQWQVVTVGDHDLTVQQVEGELI